MKSFSSKVNRSMVYRPVNFRGSVVVENCTVVVPENVESVALLIDTGIAPSVIFLLSVRSLTCRKVDVIQFMAAFIRDLLMGSGVATKLVVADIRHDPVAAHHARQIEHASSVHVQLGTARNFGVPG